MNLLFYASIVGVAAVVVAPLLVRMLAPRFGRRL